MQVLDRLERLDQPIVANLLRRQARKLAPPSDPVARATWDTLTSGQQDSMRMAAVRGDTAADAGTAWLLAALAGQHLERSARRDFFLRTITVSGVSAGGIMAVATGQVAVVGLIGVALVGVMGPWMQLVSQDRGLASARAANFALVVQERSRQAAID